jgi:hypothetical protein
MSLDGTVDVPLAGKVNKKVLAGAAGVVTALIIIYYVRKPKATPAAATTTDQYPPDGTVGDPTDPYSTDPATNQTYGNESVGSGGTFGAFTSGVGTGVGSGTFDTGSTTSSTTVGPPFSRNADWSSYVISQISSTNPNVDVGALTDAIGLYLNGQPLTPTQKQLVFDAIAVGENPPVAGANNYPPQLRSAPQGNTHVTPTVSGGHIVNLTATTAVVGWTGHDASSFRVQIKGPGPLNGRVNTVKVPQASYEGVLPGHDYTVTVTPIGTGGLAGHPGNIEFKTPTVKK